MKSFKKFLLEMPRLFSGYDENSNRIIGDEKLKTPSEYTKIGEYGKYSLFKKHSKYDRREYYAVHNDTQNVHMKVSGDFKDGIFTSNELAGKKGSEISSHRFYHTILHLDPDVKEFRSSPNHSIGGRYTWRNLANRYDDVEVTHKPGIGKTPMKMHPEKEFHKNYSQDVSNKEAFSYFSMIKK